MGKMRNENKIFIRRHHLEDLDVDGRIILKYILRK
jgi:hypothetical protein